MVHVPRGPVNAAYNVIFLGRAKPHAVDVPVLLSSLRALIERHIMLRASFNERDGRPFMRLVSADQVDVEAVDCRKMSMWRCVFPAALCVPFTNFFVFLLLQTKPSSPATLTASATAPSPCCVDRPCASVSVSTPTAAARCL